MLIDASETHGTWKKCAQWVEVGVLTAMSSRLHVYVGQLRVT